jgi:hypothetical protein
MSTGGLNMDRAADAVVRIRWPLYPTDLNSAMLMPARERGSLSHAYSGTISIAFTLHSTREHQ